MKTLFLLIAFFSFSLCYAQPPKQHLPDSVYNEMIWIAKGEIKDSNGITHTLHTTSDFYIVIRVKSTLSEESKEVCTFYKDLKYAIKLDSNAITNYDKRFFTFSNPESLEVLDFYSYNNDKVDSIHQNIGFEKLYDLAIKKSTVFINRYSGKDQIYIAHLLFNFGVMSSKGSLAGMLHTHPIEAKSFLIKEITEMIER